MTNRKDKYYEFGDDVESFIIDGGSIDDLFYIRELNQRKIFINSDIDQYTVIEAVKHILQFNKEDKGVDPAERHPILLYLTSNGGEVDAGFELIDAIITSKTPVYTINIGYQYSMGFLVGLAGHKRFATKNAKFLHHDGMSAIINSTAKAKDQMEFQDAVEAKIRKYVLEKTNISQIEYKKHARQEWYMFAEDAKKYGVTDYIVGEDCDIDDIV